jgi:hypothetical protein
VSWRAGEVDWSTGGWATAWLEGLSEQADPGNTTVFVADLPHAPEAVQSDTGQVNFRLRPLLESGTHQIRVTHRGAESNVLALRIVGDAPGIRGLIP